MDVRGKLLDLINATHGMNHGVIVDYLIANGVTITPAIPGPSEADHNIMELCFHNGERHMKEKVITMLQDVLDQANGFCMIDVSGVIKAVEDL